MKKLIAIAVVLDILWAALLATFASNFVLVLFHLAQAGHTSDVVGGIAAWIIVFVIAGLQGAVTLGVLAVAGSVIAQFSRR